MLTLAENVIIAGADDRPPMLDKTQYSSWASRMLLYIRGKENGKLLFDSVLNGPFKYCTVIVLDAEKIRESCNIKAINNVLQCLPQDIYNLLNHRTEANDISDRVKLLIEGSEISLQERESKLMTMKPIQINTKSINHLQPEWSKFATDVKLAKDLHNINFDHLYGYLRQHEAHANEVRLTRQRYPDPVALMVNTSNSFPSYSNQSQYHQQLSPIAQKYYSPPVTVSPMIHQQSSWAPNVN
ncbi:hypothetical protein Tco_0995223 [Tanacetum coccineum]